MITYFLLSGVDKVLIMSPPGGEFTHSLIGSLVGPIRAILKSGIPSKKRKYLFLYYVMMQLLVYWLYALAYKFENFPDGDSLYFAKIFLMQYIQPFLWVYPKKD